MMEKEGLLAHWPSVRLGLLEIIDSFDQEDISYIPVAGGWSVGRIMLHIGSAAEYWLHSGILSKTNTYQAGKARLTNYPTIEAIKAYLASEHEMTLALLQNFDMDHWESLFHYPDGFAYKPAWVFWHVLEHEIHHRGELSLVLGILGKEGLDA